MNADAFGYVAFSLFVAIAFLSVVIALAVVGLWVKFGNEDPALRVGLRETLVGSKEKGR